MITIEEHEIIPNVSYSQFTTWVLCGWQYYLSKIVRVPEEESVWSVGGTAYHKACELWDLGNL